MTLRNFSRAQATIALALVCAGVVAACSLTVPPEDELFANANAGAAADAGTAGSPPSGGSSGGGGTMAGTTGVVPTAAGMSNGGEAGAPELTNPEGGSDSAGGAGGGPGDVELPPAKLLLHYTFDDVSAQIAEDVTGHLLDGTLAGLSLPTGAEGHIDGALQLSGGQKQYVQLPNDILEHHSTISIASWLKLSQALAWDRLFDFNSGESNWFFFSPTGWNTNTSTFGTRCAMRTPAVLAPEIMLTETVSINVWHHIAIVFAKPFLRYYLDGELKSELTNISISSDALGATNQNWIGRSVYAADPYLSGLVDDFRIYSGALTPAEVSELAAQ